MQTINRNTGMPFRSKLTKTIGVVLDYDEYEKIVKCAKEEGTSMNRYIKYIIEHYYSCNKK